jgi:hypothetical protein
MSKAVASITLCERGIRDELLSRSLLAEKGWWVVDHEFKTTTIWVIKGPNYTGR